MKNSIYLMDMGVRLAPTRGANTSRFALIPPFETHSTCFGSWPAFKKQARRRFQEKRPFTALSRGARAPFPEPASRASRPVARCTSYQILLAAASCETRHTIITSSSSAKAP
ncbi:hypothetical protein [Paraburkholderia sp. J94]|uniref:hypothetical protein n=1 Tax=Paraburkholderia sp. J94 TaxID=2805441 RepID=UPI002AAF2C4A|nr:hypothetical protein [Paraburkholderia sp. J94]